MRYFYRVIAPDDEPPNPFHDSATISFSLPEALGVEVTVYNVGGQRIRTLARGEFAAGPHELTWDGRNHLGEPVASGIYLYRIRTGASERGGKVALLR